MLDCCASPLLPLSSTLPCRLHCWLTTLPPCRLGVVPPPLPAEVLSVDALRAERCVSCAADRTCRVWKIPEESQLIFRGHCPTIECCRYISGSEWATGSADGSVSLWSATKKKPMFTMR